MALFLPIISTEARLEDLYSRPQKREVKQAPPPVAQGSPVSIRHARDHTRSAVVAACKDTKQGTICLDRRPSKKLMKDKIIDKL